MRTLLCLAAARADAQSPETEASCLIQQGSEFLGVNPHHHAASSFLKTRRTKYGDKYDYTPVENAQRFGANVTQRDFSFTVPLREHRQRLPQDSSSFLKSGVHNHHKRSYYGNICLGQDSPRQCMVVVYDTGSGNLIVPGPDCSSPACKTHEQYSMTDTARDVDCQGSGLEVQNRIKISFGRGEIRGGCVRDSICLSDNADSCVRSDFIASDYESDNPFNVFNFDGVMGLCLTDMSQGDTFNLMQNLMDSGLLKSPVFSVFLSDEDEAESKITFGSHEPDLFFFGEENIIWQDVTRDTGYWEVQIEDVTVDNVQKDLCKKCYVAVDTGTSQLAGPSDVMLAMKEQLNVDSGCANYDSLPLLGFKLGNGHVLNMQPRDYVDNDGGTYCKVNMMDLDIPPPNGPLFIFGIPFLTKFYTVYDQASRKVGFAVAKHSYVSEEDAHQIIDMYHGS